MYSTDTYNFRSGMDLKIISIVHISTSSFTGEKAEAQGLFLNSSKMLKETYVKPVVINEKPVFLH